MYIYRFRSSECLLDKHEELKNQEIYFAEPSKLNDPMEGFKNMFWKGDKIVWRNFLKNYIRTLNHVMIVGCILKDDEYEKLDDIHFSWIYDKSHLEYNKLLIQDIEDEFFSHDFIEKIPEFLANRTSPIRFDELITYLQVVTPYALQIILKMLNKHNGNEKNLNSKIYMKYVKDFFEFMDNLRNNISKNDINLEDVFKEYTIMNDEINLLTLLDSSNNGNSKKLRYIIYDFPKRFIEKIEQLIYPDWYTACFMSDYRNSSVWGNYGDNHKGVCLIFNTKEKDNKNFLTLNHSEGSTIDYELYKVKYIEKFIDIDFFKNIGTLSKKSIMEKWFSDEEGNTSECAKEIFEKDYDFSKKYWDNLISSVTSKTKDWEYENEYRLIAENFIIDNSTTDKRKYNYNFKDLEGIIFGIKTSIKDKIKIIEIIRKKCNEINRKEFKFYQARYCPEKGEIKAVKLKQNYI
ncbi:DUF2971 domain-containing protein [Clostridium senegalense]|uniref:DUF2971 domain-containing protein n=1 Tax=Clostridium senegalense TaxID=1465809 RepID=UPI0002880965|nr:DUF2971 domain-containing protein [Clostridium senegalense]